MANASRVSDVWNARDQMNAPWHSLGMPKRSSKKKPTDLNQLAASILADITAEDSKKTEESDDDGKNPAAVALGKLGGAKGGPARAKKLSKKRRADIAKKAAKARWSK